MITSPHRILIGDVMRAVAKEYGVTKYELISHQNTSRLVIPRHSAMYIAATITGRSYAYIGERFCRNSSTVIYAIKRIKAMMAEDAACIRKMDALAEKARVICEARITTALRGSALNKEDQNVSAI